jgi:ribonucleoside-diphosphate reductase alpha chain
VVVLDHLSKLKANDVFYAIVGAAWRTGDPGLLFLDTINRSNPTPQLGSIEATNPCGEIPLLPFESCNLGSLNLAHMIQEHNDKIDVDWEKLRTTVHGAVRFLDNVIEVNTYPISESERITHGNRKIGLGIMGFAEMLILLGIPYASDAAILHAEKVMQYISEEVLKASQVLELGADEEAYHYDHTSACDPEECRV